MQSPPGVTKDYQEHQVKPRTRKGTLQEKVPSRRENGRDEAKHTLPKYGSYDYNHSGQAKSWLPVPETNIPLLGKLGKSFTQICQKVGNMWSWKLEGPRRPRLSTPNYARLEKSQEVLWTYTPFKETKWRRKQQYFKKTGTQLPKRQKHSKVQTSNSPEKKKKNIFTLHIRLNALFLCLQKKQQTNCTPLLLWMAEILHQLIWKISHYLLGFIHARWCRISCINSI